MRKRKARGKKRKTSKKEDDPSSIIIACIFIALLIIGAFLGHVTNPRDILIGYWKGEKGYLLVLDDPERTWHTSIDLLRNVTWKQKDPASPIEFFDEKGPIRGRITVEIDSSRGIDQLLVFTSLGDQFSLYRRRIRNLDFFGSLGSYTKLYFWAGVLYPDGIFRLVVLYLIIVVIAGILTLLRVDPSVAIIVLIVLLLIPFLSGYLYGLFKWVFSGWWDPRDVGRLMIYSSTVVLMYFPIYLLRRIQRFKKEEIDRRFPTLKSLLFWLLVLVDLIGLITNVHTILTWIN
jgi:hypothetical protein